MTWSLFVPRAAKDGLRVDGRTIRLDAGKLLGEGGEAEVFDIGGGLALKRFKRPDHADFASSQDAQQAARARLAMHQHKLPELMRRSFSPRIIAPRALARDAAGAIAGYTMPLVAGAEPLMKYGERGYRTTAGVSTPEAIAILRDLHGTVAALHRAGIVIGDFHDLNVLVRGSEAFLIDIDSVQFGGFVSHLFTARFLDPRLTDGQTLRPRRCHDEDSDWFSFAIMAFQLLQMVHPFGGVLQSKPGAPAVSPDARSLRRISVFHPDVKYPRHAVPLDELTRAQRDVFQAIFERDARGIFPLDVLDPLRVSVSIAPPITSPTLVTTQIRVETVAGIPKREERRFWIEGSTLLRDGQLGPEPVGNVLAGQTRVWSGPKFGFGYYRAGELTVGFVFDAQRRGIRDDVGLAPIRGAVIGANATLSESRCWFFLATVEEGRIYHRCTVLRADGSIEATLTIEPDGEHWLSRIDGHAAAGPSLLVATDEGVVRIEVRGGALVVAATFPETREYVDGATRLVAASDGLYADDHRGIRRLRVTR
jgi:hypothetical protein